MTSAPIDLTNLPEEVAGGGAKEGADPKDPVGADKALKSWEIGDDDPRWEKLTEDGGLMKLKVWEAEDKDAPMPQEGEKVKCHYSGFLREGGDLFDSSLERGQHFEFTIGQGVIKGWSEGVAKMQMGEKAILRCKSDYAYGDHGSPPKIPGGATLDFVIELVDIVMGDPIWDIEDAQESIRKRVVEKPEGWETPKESAKVIATITGRETDNKGRVFMEVKEEEITIPYDLEFDHKGVTPEFPYPRGLYQCLRNCVPKGVFEFACDATDFYTYGSAGCEKYGIAPNTKLHYRICVLSMENPKSFWSLETPEKIPWAKEMKAKAGTYFKSKKIGVAKKIYKDVVDSIKNLNGDDVTDEMTKEKDELLVACYSNIALIEVNESNLSEAMKQVEEGLKIDAKHLKLRYRKAQIEAKRTNYEQSLEILSAILKDEPENKPVLSFKKKVTTLKKNAAKKQAALAKKMFAGFGGKKK